MFLRQTREVTVPLSRTLMHSLLRERGRERPADCTFELYGPDVIDLKDGRGYDVGADGELVWIEEEGRWEREEQVGETVV